jgi:sterol desaturase/sphingolipid hydroxylase (fatty acid hydroxylase superfamily)
MHPVETFLYHGVVWWHLALPSNPLIALFQLHMAGYGAVNGHIGFDKLELTDDKTLDSHAYLHYLHHKHFEVNYGGDGTNASPIPEEGGADECWQGLSEF